ncbi:STAS domain-containing protein [Pontibacter sp. SGAir0037]|uniref:STAS domain-containing protein n=1 Tax=Pontibacter sp. SGAir0037 TaxID=2571030 RepID=UPI0010CD434E|nr:STAS domain-containing protein [Pontibacter sp. SGAir0037]QCR22627.1 hypothetical protein C1N53_09930 [Pontibacter sp. SGAir0037]
MKIKIYSHQDTEVVEVTGLIRPENLSELKQKIQSLPENKIKQICIDSSQVCKFSVSDTCFTTYVGMLLQLKTENVHLVLFGINTITERLLRILNLDSMFTIVPSLEDALKPIPEEELV